MDLVALKWQLLYGSLPRRLLLRAFLFTLGVTIFHLVQIIEDARSIEPLTMNYADCPLDYGFSPNLVKNGLSNHLLNSSRSIMCLENQNITMNAFKELMDNNLLDVSGKTLCVGQGSGLAVLALRELGLIHALAVDRHPFFSLLRRRFVYELNFRGNSFDFVFSRALDRVSVPALFLLEVERVLRPGGIGAMLVDNRDFYYGSLIRSATPVSAFLKSSNIVRVCGFGPFALVVFRKGFDNFAYFQRYNLPDECPSIQNSKPFLKYLEPLVEKASGEDIEPPNNVSYLPNYMNVSCRNRLVYINICAGEYLNASISNWLMPLYPKRHQAFNAYVIDHNPLALSAYVKKPGITFVYYPGLAGHNEVDEAFKFDGDWSASVPLNDEEFDFNMWFKNTVGRRDLVVFAMNARPAELNILFELFDSGAICHVDELFLRCIDGLHCKNSMCEDCTSLFKSLRSSGVFAHQWFGE